MSEFKPEVEVKIGLEIHVQLTSLSTKLFCRCSADYRGKPPNTLVCPVCLGFPGSLPVINEKAIEYAVMVALALRSKINRRVMFFRKHYFYPDMAKNFQITQYDRVGGAPIAIGGELEIEVEGKRRTIRIRRINVEEDPARIVYPTGSIATSPYSLIDYNRSGVALLEIVTEPDIKSPREARLVIEKLRTILEHLGVSQTTLEGALRVDANISIKGGGRVEIKNIGSSKDVERALSYELLRQKEALERGEEVKRETRHWDSVRGVTVKLRVKEEEQDYRYFPEPDLPPLILSKEYVEALKYKLPELPDQRVERFKRQYGLSEYDAKVLVSDKSLADFFEKTVEIYPKPSIVAHLLINDFLRWLKENDMEVYESKAEPKHIAKLLKLMEDGVISGKIMKQVLPKIIVEGVDPSEIVREEGLVKISDVEVVRSMVLEVFRENPKAVRDALENPKAINFIIGQIMRKSRGRADPELANKIVREELEKVRKSG